MNKHCYIVPEESRLGKAYIRWAENELVNNAKIVELFADLMSMCR